MELLAKVDRAADVVPFVAQLASFGDRAAVVDCGQATTYEQLARAVEDVADRLGAQRRLAIVRGGNDLEALIGYLGALAGGHAVLLADGDGELAARRLIDAYDPDVTIGFDDCKRAIDERRDGTAHDLHPDLALLLSTSGSTGSPKLVRLSRENLQSNAAAIVEYLGIRTTDRAATTLPMHYCYGLSVVNSYLLRGATLVLTDLSVADGCFWDLFHRQRVTSFAGVPHTFELLERVGFAEMELPHLRYVTQAGGKLAPERVKRFAQLGRVRGWDFYAMYGQTEATARIAYLPPDLAASTPNVLGVAIPGGELGLEPLAEHDDPSVGELVYRGPNVMLGYAECSGDLALGRSVDALRTGDLARRTSDGSFEIVGRRNRFLKLFGLRIDLDRAQALLNGRGFTTACVGNDDKLVIAIEGDDDPGEARKIVSAEFGLPASAVSAVCFAQLPRVASGKFDYPAITEFVSRSDEVTRPAVDGSGGATADLPGLRALFAEVLDQRHVSGQSTFVSLGGDSLSYVEMSVALEERLGRLPANWHVTPLEDLAMLNVSKRRFIHTVETSILMRAIAIILIAGSHASVFAVRGGAHALIAVAGFNFARFLTGPAGRRQRVRKQVRSVARIVVPSVIWIAFAAAYLSDSYNLTNVLLLNAIAGPATWSHQWNFWFVEVLVYMMIASAALLAVAPISRAERRWPFRFALTLLSIGLLTRFRVIDIGITNTMPVFWLFALGWAIAKSTSHWQRLLLTGVVLAAVPGFFADSAREAVIGGGVLLLMWLPAVQVPALFARVAAVLASASLFIYLTHWQVFPRFDSQQVGLAVSLAVGIAYWLMISRTPVLARKLWSRLRDVRRPGWPVRLREAWLYSRY